MIDLRERAEWWGVKPQPLIDAVESAKKGRRYEESQKSIIASALPARTKHRLEQAHKAIAALPLRGRVHLHWRMAERIAYGFNGTFTEQMQRAMQGLPNPLRLTKEQVRCVMSDIDWVEVILDALSEPLDTEAEDELQERRQLVRAWVEAGGQLLVDDRYDGDLIEFLQDAYEYLGETPTPNVDTVRRRLDRIRRGPLETEG